MPYSFSYLPEQRLVLCHLTGRFDIHETVRVFEVLASDPEVGRGWGVLVDARERAGAPTLREAAELMRTIESVRRRLSGRIAFLLSTAAQWGMGQKAEDLAESHGLPVRAFLDEREALGWLGGVEGVAASGEGARAERPARLSPVARVLVIDDDASVRRAIRLILEREGHVVLEAADGAEGLRLFREAPLDLVVTDLVMPGKEGIETIIELRETYPALKILVVSGAQGEELQAPLEDALLLGADAVLGKPFDVRKLQEVVARLLRAASQ